MPDQYWRTDRALHAAAPGLRILPAQDIEITSDDPSAKPTILAAPRNFQTYTGQCLNLLYRTAAGRRVLDTLVATPCTIGFSTGNSAGVGHAEASMKPAMWEILHQGKPGDAARAAMEAGFARQPGLREQRATLAALARAVNAQPRWRLDQAPGADSGWWASAQSWRDYANRWLRWSSDPGEGYFDKELYTARWGVSRSGLAVTVEQMLVWMRRGILPHALSDDNKQQLKLATAVALYPHARPGRGSPSAVRFAVGPHDAYRHQRPPAIALGHELVHAYFSHKGLQPGEEFGHFSTALFEFRCVGLGPWNDEAVSENALRAQWGAVVGHVPRGDAENRRVPGKRIRY